MKSHRLLLGLFCFLFLCSLATGQAPARPADRGPASRPAERSTARNGRSERERNRLRFLSKRSIELLKAGKYAEAENALADALSISPLHSVNLYNMACCQALLGNRRMAVQFLEKAALTGFTDFVHIERDPDLESLRELPSYKQLLARRDWFQRKAADLVVQWLKGELGQGYLFEIDEQNKLIFATNTDPETLAALKKSLTAQARSQWEMIFSHKLDQYVSVIVPSAEDFREVVRQPGVGGFYNHDNRILFAQRLGQVMNHEFTHALHNADTDPLGQDHAIWLAEGLGVMFEGATFEGEKFVPGDNFRLPFMQSAARNNKLVPLAELLTMDQKAFVANSRVTLTYGQSGSLLLWLYDTGLLRPFYDTYKTTYDQDKTGKLALEQTVKAPLNEIERQWMQWMVNRKALPLWTGPGGPYLGVRFGQGNDGLRVDSLVENGPGVRGGLKVGDVVVGIDQVDIRDHNSLIPVLSNYSVGDRVTLKVRREGMYLDVPVVLGKRDEARRPVPARR